jgi:hypothetical protein
MPLNPGGSYAIPGAKFPGFGSSQYYPPTIPFYTVSTTKQSTSGRLYAMPFYCPNTKSFTGISIEQTSATTGNVRMGVYNDSNGYPSSLKVDAGAVAFPGSTGIRTGTATIALTGGLWYWLAAVFDTNTMQYVGPSDGDSSFNFAMSSDHGIHTTAATFNTGNITSVFYASQAYGALPDPFPSFTAYNGNAPFLCLKG